MTLLYVKNPSEGEQEIALLLPEATYHFHEAREIGPKWYLHSKAAKYTTGILVLKELCEWD
jgi:hypothetical protein